VCVLCCLVEQVLMCFSCIYFYALCGLLVSWFCPDFVYICWWLTDIILYHLSHIIIHNSLLPVSSHIEVMLTMELELMLGCFDVTVIGQCGMWKLWTCRLLSSTLQICCWSSAGVADISVTFWASVNQSIKKFLTWLK